MSERHIMRGLVASARVEVSRCEAALLKGSSASFWKFRLSAGVFELEAAAAVLREQIQKIEAQS
jgi:UDP-3-O-acyl-N-acetylglucosamine deacetylase